MKIQYLRTIFLGELYEFLFRFLGLRGRQPHKPRSSKKRGFYFLNTSIFRTFTSPSIFIKSSQSSESKSAPKYLAVARIIASGSFIFRFLAVL